MPKTNEILLKLEGFHYATSLYLYMGYYHIRLLEKAQVTYVQLLSSGVIFLQAYTNGSCKLIRHFPAENE